MASRKGRFIRHPEIQMNSEKKPLIVVAYYTPYKQHR